MGVQNCKSSVSESSDAPNFEKKIEGAYCFGLVRPSVLRPLQIQDRALKFHRWILHQKITDPYFF